MLGGQEAEPKITQSLHSGLQTKLLLRAPYVTPLNVLQVGALTLCATLHSSSPGYYDLPSFPVLKRRSLTKGALAAISQVQTLYFLRLVAKSENGEECTPEETQALKRLRELTRFVNDEWGSASSARFPLVTGSVLCHKGFREKGIAGV